MSAAIHDLSVELERGDDHHGPQASFMVIDFDESTQDPCYIVQHAPCVLVKAPSPQGHCRAQRGPRCVRWTVLGAAEALIACKSPKTVANHDTC